MMCAQGVYVKEEHALTNQRNYKEYAGKKKKLELGLF